MDTYNKYDSQFNLSYDRVIKEAEQAKKEYWAKQGHEYYDKAWKPGTDGFSDCAKNAPYVPKHPDEFGYTEAGYKEATKTTPADWTLYVIVRSLPSMTNGKAQAHSGHAACAFLFQCAEFREVKKWMGSTTQGFGTQINLQGDENDTTEFVEFCKERFNKGYHGGYVYDPTYPYVVGKEMYPLIADERHTLPAKYNADQGRWLCFRHEWTASFGFVDKNDPDVKKLMEKFILSP